MAAESQVKVILKGEDQTRGAIESAEKGIFGLSKTAVDFGKIVGAVFAVDKIVDFGKAVFSSAMEAEKATAQLNAVLESTHHAAGLFTQDILDQASALQSYTTFNDEAITSAASLLLTFTNIKGAVFQEALPAILDLSQAMGQDLKGSAVQVGKALNDPIEGVNALRRVGVSFTDKQRDLIETLVKTGKTMEAQRMILKELSTEFGGSAEAAANTFDGKLKQLANSFDDLKESIGKVLIEAVLPLIDGIVRIVDVIKTWDISMEGIRAGLQNLAIWIDSHTGLITYMREIWETVVQVFQEHVIPVFREVWSKHGPLLTELGKALATVFGTLLVVAIKVLVDIIAVLAIGFASILNIGAKLFDVAMTAWEKTIDAFSAAWNGAKNVIESVANAIQKVIDLAAKAGSKVAGALGISGARADGGPVDAGKTYLVGERGPELFVPRSNGAIVPSLAAVTPAGMTFNISVSGNTLLDGNAGEKIGEQIMRTLKTNLRI